MSAAFRGISDSVQEDGRARSGIPKRDRCSRNAGCPRGTSGQVFAVDRIRCCGGADNVDWERGMCRSVILREEHKDLTIVDTRWITWCPGGLWVL